MKKHVISFVLASLLAIASVGCSVYLSDYYHADTEAIAAFPASQGVTRRLLNDNTLVFEPESPSVGLIFYSGGKVEHAAYEPLMQACAAEGMLCILPEMPFHLAVLDIHAARGIPEQYPYIEQWYIGGHSLGGSMAASHLAEDTTEFDGLILLGAYSTADLSGSHLKVLSVYGSEDTVLDHENYASCRFNLPSDMTELILDGGCHAYFGMYGPQAGDGSPTLSNIAQINLTAQAIVDLTLY